MSETLGPIATRAYRRAQSSARRAMDTGRLQPSEANTRLLPWLAMAAHAGADLPELVEEQFIYFHSGPSTATAPPAHRRMISSEIAPREEWVPVLVEARDAALARHEANPSPENHEAASDLLLLLGSALAFTGLPHIPPPPLAQICAPLSERTAA